MPGLHKVSGTLAAGRVAEYWYAWRGGPRILKAAANTPEALAREVARLAPGACAKFESLTGKPEPDSRFLSGVIASYLESAKFKQLSPRTKADYRAALDVARVDIGQLETRLLKTTSARGLLIAWRDRYQATPKTADARLGALAIVLQWAENRGELKNPLKDWPRIYRANRAHVIWTEADLARLLDKSEPAFARAVLFAAYSGLRLGDLVTITKAAIRDNAIVWQTGKSGGRRTVIVPITDALRALLEAMPPTDAVTILASSRGTPWTIDGLQTAMQRAKRAAGITGLRFHDLRGTAVTHLIRAGVTLQDVALLVGWSPKKVEGIATRYVTSEAVALAIVERMRRNASGMGV